MTRPNFAVAADETPYRRLGAALREEIYRLQQSSYSFGVQSESGLVRLDVAQTALGASRDRIYSKIESLLMLVDIMAEMKDVNVHAKGRRTRVQARAPQSSQGQGGDHMGVGTGDDWCPVAECNKGCRYCQNHRRTRCSVTGAILGLGECDQPCCQPPPGVDAAGHDRAYR